MLCPGWRNLLDGSLKAEPGAGWRNLARPARPINAIAVGQTSFADCELPIAMPAPDRLVGGALTFGHSIAAD